MAEAAVKPRLERAVVRPGRTIIAPDPAAPKVFGGRRGQTFEEMFVPATVEYGPNSEVELPHDEVVRLRELGYLIDPNARVIPAAGEIEKGATVQTMQRR